MIRNGMKKFSSSYYYCKIDNFEIPRQWICYSPKLKRPYCEVCWLFGVRDNHKNQAWVDGVAGNMKNMHRKITKHEKSKAPTLNTTRIGGRAQLNVLTSFECIIWHWWRQGERHNQLSKFNALSRQATARILKF